MSAHDVTPLPASPVLRTEGILDRLAALRAADAPTHGGRVLSYVYDPDLSELDVLAGEAIRAVQPLNGLDPTTFSSVAVMERELVAFARDVLHGSGAQDASGVVGTVTSGGTESCVLAVKTARDAFLAAQPPLPDGAPRTLATLGFVPRVVAPATVHPAFHKAAAYLGLDLVLVPVDPTTCRAVPAAMAAAVGDGHDVALVVVSAPSYPHGVVDPVEEVAASASAAGVPVHVDACVGGWVLPFWPDDAGKVPLFDFRVPGVTSISADVHKYGYSPKGASLLLTRDRDRQRHQLFATTRWPGYPVVNSTIMGSKSAGPLAAAWAVTQALGVSGYGAVTARCAAATGRLRAVLDSVEGLRVVGTPVGPLVAVAADESLPADRQVDPHVWSDAVRASGFVLQPQPGYTQPDGSRLPHTTHLTVTPVTAGVVEELGAALVAAADAVRGVPRPDPHEVLGALVATLAPGVPTGEVLAALGSLDSRAAWDLVQAAVLGGEDRRGGGAPEPGTGPMAPLLALVEALPATVSERLLVELIARLAEPVDQAPSLPGERSATP
ncbi:aspartate aminotransferase family protein [Oerskovia sp. Sa1BUA8]|uniref:Aspartate aminotransferase family protein n=1 Tax=Oerskovia douganii TaxID=2762210 RepID=A0A9D5YYA5_9CELL|nr:pyridoxal-dependent decarboxylase [Oerskovia douganii]MBE7699985.1 aspartate aminotransferase family protein [Oerskovia douganii]